MRRTSRRCATRSDRGYVIDGRKVWVANAAAAELLIVFASTQPGIRSRGISAFLVPMQTPGIRRVATDDSLGVRGLGCMDLEFTNVEVGADARARATRRRLPHCHVGFGWRPRRDRGAGARRWRGGPRAKRSSTRRRARRSASRSETTRRSSGCWPTSRPSSTRRGCSRSKPRIGRPVAARRRSSRDPRG